MTNAEILKRVKIALGITGDYQDETVTEYIVEVKSDMADAGVQSTVINAESSVGCICRGVADLWNYGNGTAKLSPYFIQRMLQLKAVQGGEHNG